MIWNVLGTGGRGKSIRAPPLGLLILSKSVYWFAGATRVT
jgi:hypothetical protein